MITARVLIIITIGTMVTDSMARIILLIGAVTVCTSRLMVTAG